MAAATKKKQFLWNKGDKIQNFIIVSLISKLRWKIRTSTSMQTRLTQHEVFREAMDSASLKMYFLPMQVRLSGGDICGQRQVSF